MAKKIRVINTGNGGIPNVFPPKLLVKSGTVGSIANGDLVVKDGSNAGYAAKAADGTASTAVIAGVAAMRSTETGSLDGIVEIVHDKELLVEIYAKVPANLTVAKRLSKYVLDVTGDDVTLDESNTTNGFITLLDYDASTGLCRALIACSL